MQQDTVGKITLLVVLALISVLFLYMIKNFLMALFLAGIFSAMLHPLYRRIRDRFNGRSHLASAMVLLLVILCIMLPLLALAGIVVSQAVQVGESVTPWVKRMLSEPGNVTHYLSYIPYYEEIAPYREDILQKAGQAVGAISKFLIDRLSSFTLGTLNFIFLSFIFLYTMFFLLIDGKKLIDKILYYLPLGSGDEQRMLDKFTSVTRATLKGTFLIGILQGFLNGVAFAIAGIPYAAFWGTLMAVLSAIPSIGSPLVWGPAVIILLIQGKILTGILLLAFCGTVVGSMDNILRPILVGKDTQMHELLILFSTLGGIIMFGIAGIIIGPIIASLFITIWDIYGIAFRDVLPPIHTEDAGDEKQ